MIFQSLKIVSIYLSRFQYEGSVEQSNKQRSLIKFMYIKAVTSDSFNENFLSLLKEPWF